MVAHYAIREQKTVHGTWKIPPPCMCIKSMSIDLVSFAMSLDHFAYLQDQVAPWHWQHGSGGLSTDTLLRVALRLPPPDGPCSPLATVRTACSAVCLSCNLLSNAARLGLCGIACVCAGSRSVAWSLDALHAPHAHAARAEGGRQRHDCAVSDIPYAVCWGKSAY